MFIWQPAAGAMVTTGEEDGDNYTMVYPLVYVDDAGAQQAINDDIAGYLDRFRDAMVNGIEDPGIVSGRLYYDEGRIRTETKYEDADAVSLTLIDYRNTGGAHGSYVVHALTYDKHTGDRLVLGKYLHIRPADLNQELYTNLYDGQGKPMHYKGAANPIHQVPEDYYLLPDGGIALQFQIYHLGSYADGAVTIRLNADKVAFYNSH